jgi:hypothetical protein
MAHASIVGTYVRLVIGAFALLAAPMAGLAAAQDRPGPAAEFEAGWVGFADDGVISESPVGGAVRLYLRPRLSVGPEVVYIHGDNHSHLMVTGNATWDLLAPTNGRPPSITPFFGVGGGVFQTRETFFSGTFTSSEGAFTVGGGVRAVVQRPRHNRSRRARWLGVAPSCQRTGGTTARALTGTSVPRLDCAFARPVGLSLPSQHVQSNAAGAIVRSTCAVSHRSINVRCRRSPLERQPADQRGTDARIRLVAPATSPLIRPAA